jgi:hypothetical protein
MLGKSSGTAGQQSAVERICYRGVGATTTSHQRGTFPNGTLSCPVMEFKPRSKHDADIATRKWETAMKFVATCELSFLPSDTLIKMHFEYISEIESKRAFQE